MENQLIQLYVLVCHTYDTQSETCFQRLSNNSKTVFTDQELVTIYLFGHLQGLFEKKAVHKLIDSYWREFFPTTKELSAPEKYYNRLVSRLRQPIESFCNWLIDKTDIQRAGTVRSTEGLMIHCFGKLTFAFYLLVFNPWFTFMMFPLGFASTRAALRWICVCNFSPALRFINQTVEYL